MPPEAVPILKRHGLRPAASATFNVDEARIRIARLQGVISSSWNGIDLAVEYDLRRITLDQIEKVTAGAGLTLKGGWHRLQRDWWKFGETNELSNATRSGDGACCNRPPARR
ncbi:hypothetical protein [Denitratisoma oestradiolicum]|uniref:hypothetical protein n=1 Tax=Denitratisoma oestradiolicum TaxID=311182 RepID=UPI0011A8E760|nr:hypothetical protein [Denitratisoma oestradiolicum]TWO82102.1 hypothetical protein CBW56_01285 [Denitratisoma oestradiolicum]